jgi:hypothetical protein
MNHAGETSIINISPCTLFSLCQIFDLCTVHCAVVFVS